MAQAVTVLQDFGLSPEIEIDVLQAVWGEDIRVASTSRNLVQWLQLLPEEISSQITMALNQERPFLPPDLTPEMMAMPNKTIPSMNHIEIIYRCIDFALKAEDFATAAALVYVVDRACYRFGRSAALLSVVDEIQDHSPDTPIAPQVILRQARVMKDNGDLHTAMRILDEVISQKRKWDYKTVEQYENTKAVCVQIKGQILHNLGLWKEAVLPLVESVHSFSVVRDNKGISSSLGLLSRCLKKLGNSDYQDLQHRTAGIFHQSHPCYEAYVRGLEAVHLIQDLGTTVYVTHNQLLADESLLMYTVQQKDLSELEKREQFQVIVKEMIRSLGAHRTVHYLQSLEVYLAFLRALFTVALTLAFSLIKTESDLAALLERVCLELYDHACSQLQAQVAAAASPTLRLGPRCVRLMNHALALLGLPPLEGTVQIEEGEQDVGSGSDARAEMLKRDQNERVQEETEQEASAAAPLASTWQAEESANVSSSESVITSGGSSPHSLPDMAAASSSSHRLHQSEPTDGQFRINSQSQTFPSAIKPSRASHTLSKSPAAQKPFVGLQMSREELKAATWPSLVPDLGSGQVKDQSEEDENPVNVDSLLLSAQTFASTSAGTKEQLISMPPGGAQPASVDSKLFSSEPESRTPGSWTSDQSLSTQAISLGTSQPAASVASNLSPSEPESKTPGSWTVDQSLSALAMSSGTSLPSSSSSNSLRDGVAAPPSSLSPPLSTQDHAKPAAASSSSGNSIRAKSSSSITVDPSAETVPSSPSNTTDLSDSSLLSSLVDIPSACALVSDLHLGSSMQTSDSGQFLANFIPTENSDVHRSVVYTYSPVDGAWSAQTTLAYLGPLLDTVTKGANRDTFHVNFLHQDEPLGRYVGKRYRRSNKPPGVYMQDVVCQMLAGFYVTRYNQALQNCPYDILQVQFLSAAHLQVFSREGTLCDWVNVEPFLHGSFIKLTNNLRFVSRAEENLQGVEVATALSHFSYVETGGKLMVVDIQGWMPQGRKGVVYLTDPVFHTLNMREFSSGDRHKEGMAAFWANQHPTCNHICHYLGLHKTRPDGEISLNR